MLSSMRLYVFLLVVCMWLSRTLGHSDYSKLLLISFDGFRWDYLDRANGAGFKTPNFQRLINEGVKATVKNSFTTKTFPNHYTIATGLYEENHGVVSNEMYDPLFNETFIHTRDQSMDPKWWNNGTSDWKGAPIWIANENKDALFPRRSGVFFWPGSEAPIHGKYPTHYRLYDKNVTYETRINTVVSWFRDEEIPINFGAMYFNEPDHTGHEVGPNDLRIYDVIVSLDNYVGSLLTKLSENDLLDSINIIITSDHGMAQTDNVIFLEDFVNTTLFIGYGGSPVMNIRPLSDKYTEEIYTSLKDVPNLHVYKKEDIPPEFHYTHNRRIMPIVASAAEGYNVCVRNDSTCWHAKGNHGYNNSLNSMHPFFIARGPAFKRGYTALTFRNVDIYALMCAILDITPAQHDGDFKNTKSMLIKHDNSTTTMVTYMLVIALAATVTAIMTVAVLRVTRYHRHRQLARLPPPRKSLSLNNVYVDEPQVDGRTHLLVSDDEEIP